MAGVFREPVAVQFSILSPPQCKQIVGAAYEVLERVGTRFHHREAVEILRKAGCTVTDSTLVHIPPGLVDEALGTAPESFTLYTREGEPALQVRPGSAHFGPGPTCPNFVDPHTGARRPFVKRDAALVARACDALPEIDYVMSLGNVMDVPPHLACVHEFDAMVRETTKPIMSWAFGRDSLAQIHAICTAIKGSPEAVAREPFMIHYAEPSSPLKHTAEALEKLLYCAQHEIPLVYTPCPMAGATAPATMAGILVQNLAETLGGLVVGQCVRPGTPLVVGGVVSILDMRTTVFAYGAPELALLSAAATEVARSIGLPAFSTAGCTDAKRLDQQAALEATFSILTAALSGAGFIHDVGFSESGLTGSLPLLVMSDEVIGMARHLTRGIRVEEDTLAVGAIAQARATSEFLSLEHTAHHFRHEFWFPRLLDRTRYAEWQAGGEQTLEDRVLARMHCLLSEHQAPSLPAGTLAELDCLLRTAT